MPYKIHNHVHTHTNYKVVKVPESHIENTQEASQNEEEVKYLDKEIHSILSGTKIPHHLKDNEEFKPQTFPTISAAEPSVIPMHRVHEPKAIQTFHGISDSEHVIATPTRIPGFHTTLPDYQFGEGKVYIQTYSTQAPLVPFYSAQIVHPTYQVEEKQTSAERISSPLPSFDPFSKISKLQKDASFARNYFNKNPYTIRTSKYLPTTKAIKLQTTKLYSLPTIPTKTYALPTTKNFIVPTTKVPKTLFKNNAEYEHIGYLVVGENSQKFVGINEKK